MALENYSYLREMANKGVRLDGRGPLDKREIKIKTNVINHADGSASVSIGKTSVIAGVKVLPGEPYPDKPDEGSLVVNFEASDLASNYSMDDKFVYSVEIGRVTDRAIRESKMIDMKKLIIEPGKQSLFVYVDIYAINNDGNLFDASNLAALAALLTTEYKIEGKDEKIKLPIDLNLIPISTTFVKIDNQIFADPNQLEEDIADARITIGVGDGINSIQKGGYGFFTIDEIDQCAQNAISLKEKVKDLLLKSINF